MAVRKDGVHHGYPSMTVEQRLMASATIIVPCFNEEKRLNVDCFRNFVDPSHKITFLFVNDGSRDGTLRLLESLKISDPAKFGILDFQSNRGKAEAVRQGFLATRAAGVDYVGFWDADLATPLSTIAEFIDLAESRPALQIIIGSRVKLLGKRIERRRSRHYIGRIFATVASTILDLEVYDTQCGAKLFRASSAMYALFQQPFRSRWIFDVEILARLIQARRGKDLPRPKDIIYEFPLTVWRDIPGSKLKIDDFVRAGWELINIRNCYFRN
jgi:glycosyltransferase involved in cell wall biosynthesis